MYILPRQVLRAVDSICAKFLLNGCIDKKGCHLVKWQDVGRNESEGGLGISNLHVLNNALVVNQLWNMMKDNKFFGTFGIRLIGRKGWEIADITKSSWFYEG
ncbi:hypothetical protein QQ045_026145 [Rhodiola kirilowii]